MFADAIPHHLGPADVTAHAEGAFGATVRLAELAAAASAIAAADPAEIAQQLWIPVHGAVSLELRGLAQTPDPAATYGAFSIRSCGGLAP